MKIKVTVRFIVDNIIDDTVAYLFRRVSERFGELLGIPSDVIIVEEDTDD